MAITITQNLECSGNKPVAYSDKIWMDNTTKTLSEKIEEIEALLGGGGSGTYVPSFKIENGNLYYQNEEGRWVLLGKVEGDNGKDPIFKIEGGHLKISFDGLNWTDLGKVSGSDGSTIEFIYYRCNTYYTVDNPFPTESLPDNSWAYDAPQGNWTDNPSGVNTANKYEYVSVRYIIAATNEAKTNWSTPSLWSVYSDNTLSDDELQRIADEASAAGVSAANAAVAQATRDINDLKAAASDATSRLNGIDNKISSLENTNTELGTRVDEAHTKMTEIAQDYETISLTAASAASDAADNKARITSLEVSATGISGKVESLESTVNGYTTRIGDLEASDTKFTTRIGSVETGLSGALNKIATLEQTDTKISERVTDAKETADGVKTDLATAQSTLTAYGKKITTLQTDYTNVQSSVNDLTSWKNSFTVFDGRYLMNDDEQYVDENGYVICTVDEAGSTSDYVGTYKVNGVVYEKDGEYYTIIDKSYVNISSLIGSYDVQPLTKDDDAFADKAVMVVDAISRIAQTSKEISLLVKDDDDIAALVMNTVNGGTFKVSANHIDLEGIVKQLIAKKIITDDSGDGHITIQDNFMQLYKNGSVRLNISSDEISLESGVNVVTTEGLSGQATWISSQCDRDEITSTIQSIDATDGSRKTCVFNEMTYALVGEYTPSSNVTNVSVRSFSSNKFLAGVSGSIEGASAIFSLAFSTSSTSIDNSSTRLDWRGVTESITTDTPPSSGQGVQSFDDLSQELEQATQTLYIWAAANTQYRAKVDYESDCRVAYGNTSTIYIDFAPIVIEAAGADSYQMKIGANGLSICLENGFNIVMAKDSSGNQLIKLVGKNDTSRFGIALNNKGLYLSPDGATAKRVVASSYGFSNSGTITSSGDKVLMLRETDKFLL